LYSIEEKYPQLSKRVDKTLVFFPTTYLYVAGFSSCISTKITYHNRLKAETDKII
jgi:hypothetical protein